MLRNENEETSIGLSKVPVEVGIIIGDTWAEK
jgi:hypothetical protein